MGDITDFSFDLDTSIYKIGFYQKINNDYIFKSIKDNPRLLDQISDTTIKEFINSGDIEKHVKSEYKKTSSKNLFIFILLFIIIGNSSIYYYFEQVKYEDIGIINFGIKCLYHYIGFIFLIKIIQYMYFTCVTSYYLGKFNDKLISYIIDPFNTDASIVQIIPVSNSQIDNINKQIFNTITTDDMVNTKSLLTIECIKTDKDTPVNNIYNGLDWTSFIFSVIVLYYIALKTSLCGIPIYGMLYYYNPLACFNLSGFYELINPLWKLNTEVCEVIKKREAHNSGRDVPLFRLTDRAERKVNDTVSHYTNDYLRTYYGIEDMLAFDAYRVRSIKIHKTISIAKHPLGIVNIIAQLMYIYNCALIFFNPLTAFLILIGLGYVPSTPIYFVNGDVTLKAMKKIIRMPFYKRWLFYFTQGRCYKSNIFTGIIRRFCTMGLDVWTADSLFNNDILKLTCNGKKYFKLIFLISLLVLFLNSPNYIGLYKTTADTPSYHYIPMITNILIVIFIAYKIFQNKDAGDSKIQIFENENDSTKNDKLIDNLYKINSYDIFRNYICKFDVNQEYNIKHMYELICIYLFICAIIIISTASSYSTLANILFGISILLIVIIRYYNSDNSNNEKVVNNLKKLQKLTNMNSPSSTAQKGGGINQNSNKKHITSDHNIEENYNYDFIHNKNTNRYLSVVLQVINKYLINYKPYKESEDNTSNSNEKVAQNLKKLESLVEPNKDDSNKNVANNLENLEPLVEKNQHTSNKNVAENLKNLVPLVKKNNNQVGGDNSSSNSYNIYSILDKKKIRNIRWAHIYSLICILSSAILFRISNKNIIGLIFSLLLFIISICTFEYRVFIHIYNILLNRPETRTECIKSNSNTNSTDSVTELLKDYDYPKSQYIKNSKKDPKNNDFSYNYRGQKYNDWTQFFTGGSEYEDQSLFLTKIECDKNSSGKTKEICTKFKKLTNPDVAIGIISISFDDFKTLLSNKLKNISSKDKCLELYKNKPRCINVVKFMQKIKGNGGAESEPILELNTTNRCSGESGKEVNMNNSVFEFKDTASKEDSDSSSESSSSSSESESTQAGGSINNSRNITKNRSKNNSKSMSNVFDKYRSKLESNKKDGKQYYFPIEFLNYKKGIKYKIKDIQVDPVNNKIKIFGLDEEFEYSDQKLQEIVISYIEEQEVEEIVNNSITKDEEMKKMLSYEDYIKYEDSTNNSNEDVQNETANRYMATGGYKSNFKTNFRNKFRKVIQDQNIIDTFLKENKNKVQPNKYDNIMKMDNKPVIIKTGLKERYMTKTGELLPVKPKSLDKDYVDVVTLNDEPMKINVKGKECYMTKDGGLINVRQHKNIYKRKKFFKKRKH